MNDSAERVFKRHFDFLNTSKIEAGLQRVLQVVDNCRSHLPNQRKRKLESKRHGCLSCENENDYLCNAFIDLNCSLGWVISD